MNLGTLRRYVCQLIHVREHIETFQNDREVLDGNVYFNIKCYSSTYKYPFTLVDLPGLPGNSSDQNYRAALDMALKHIRDLEGMMHFSQHFWSGVSSMVQKMARCIGG